MSWIKEGAEGKILVFVDENVGATSSPVNKAAVVYTFGARMRVESVTGGDLFIKLFDQLSKEGKLPNVNLPKYYEELKDSVQYWDGEKLSQEKTMNKRYVEVQHTP